ncbi:tyrosine-type recombinase/integrase [Aneurinibacillus terranovensis]|uniref:tyrosine-type recombinase/integrase n=1 Tax=Aneurinibacillus terranovensis TaxID=278991 RepID=UPI000683EA03|nr:tyrosine-type recombinase/integrase [Aneurinibacillus terranovensis]
MTYPLKDVKDIDEMKEYFLNVQENKRNYLLFMTGISSALRISDILKLKVQDISDGKKAKDHIVLKEIKTGKRKEFAVSQNLKKAINAYLHEYTPELDDYVFISRQGDEKPITRQRAVQILKQALDACGLSYINFGSHGMRKTFSYHLYKRGTDIYYLMRLLNHSSPKQVLAYIGIEQEELDRIYINLNL